ncbi:MAG: enoyl-CoA hydratase-related protein [Pseudomonas sp.]|uniref:enoyl-CoA hydratase-related protein n=1 Tax=Pseudomonas sp. TaxID=306 RepID=UPI003982737A
MNNATPCAEPPILLTRREGKALVVTLNRPERLNALTPELHAQLREAVESAAHDRSVTALVLTGAGRAFCSGGDMNNGSARGEARPGLEQRADELRHHAETARLLHSMPKPTIAMINGAAAGAGLALALACDLRIASSDAVLRTAYANVALSGDLGISWFLTRLVGPAKALELMYLNEKIAAAEALGLGLVNRVEAPDDLAEAALSIAAQLADGPGVALRYMKRNVTLSAQAPLEMVLDTEAYGMARCGRTQDIKEAVLAFREKRAPSFTGT